MKWPAIAIACLLAGCATTGGSDIPDGLQRQYSELLEAANALAVANGYQPFDGDLEIETTIGTRQEGERWIAWDKVKMVAGKWEYGWVAGYAVPGRIWLITSPEGFVSDRVFRHEIWHIILFSNGVPDAKHHEIMKGLKVY